MLAARHPRASLRRRSAPPPRSSRFSATESKLFQLAIAIQGNYKDTLFGSLFYSCDEAVENAKALYKALTGKEVHHAEKCRLEDVLFRQFMNDVAYIMDDVFICFIEHQSSINPNMALRLLIYLARTYERFFTGDDLYRSTLIKVPTPEFYVLYNGKDKLKTDTLTLSSMFKSEVKSPQAEVIVKVIDINYDNLSEIVLKNCKILSDYSFVIDTVRKYDGDVEAAIKECIEQGVLSDYLKHYGSEVVNMLFEEYDAERALEIRGQEEYEKGFLKALVDLVKDGLLTLSEAAKRANMTVEDFEKQSANLT